MKDNNKIVKSLWIGKELSALERLSMTSFIKNDHEYHLYVYNDIRNIPDEVVLKDANHIIPENQIFTGAGPHGIKGFLGAFSDFFRHKILYEYGGWWVDTDVVCIKPFDFTDIYVYSSEHTPVGGQEATTAVIKLPRKSKEAEYCWNYCASIKDVSKIQFLNVGPHLVRKSIERYENQRYIKNWKTFMPVHWWEIYKFIIPNDDFQLTDDVYALHFWNEIWRYHGYDKNAHYPGDSIYEQLKQFYHIN